jgi:hypothetical protein
VLVMNRVLRTQVGMPLINKPKQPVIGSLLKLCFDHIRLAEAMEVSSIGVLRPAATETLFVMKLIMTCFVDPTRH